LGGEAGLDETLQGVGPDLDVGGGVCGGRRQLALEVAERVARIETSTGQFATASSSFS
jgi:hypothetical protein